MKVIYTNAPRNRQQNKKSGARTALILVSLLAVMGAIKVFYPQSEGMTEAAQTVMATVNETSDTTEEQPES